MAGSDKRKQSLYFPEDMLKEIQDEATRQDRSLSWIGQKAWKISRKEIMKYPSVNEFPGAEDESDASAKTLGAAPLVAGEAPLGVMGLARALASAGASATVLSLALPQAASGVPGLARRLR